MWIDVLAQANSASGGDGGTGWAQILLSVVGPAGLIGALVALLKLKPEANSAAVTQAQGASAEWKLIADDRKAEINELEAKIRDLTLDRDRWKLRAEARIGDRVVKPPQSPT